MREKFVIYSGGKRFAEGYRWKSIMKKVSALKEKGMSGSVHSIYEGAVRPDMFRFDWSGDKK